MDEEDEILSFRPTKPLKESLAEALRQAKAKTVDVKPKSKKWSKSESDEEEREHRSRRGKKRRQAEESVAARLMRQAEAMEQCPHTTSAASKEDGDESSEEKDVKQFSPPPSPIPSPPPLVFLSTPEPKQSKTLANLLKAEQMLHELRQPQPSSAHLSDLDNSSLLEVSGVGETPPILDQKLTLRVRHRGKMFRFTVEKDDPLILLCSELGRELGVKGEQILLSHRTTTLSTSSSPASLGLSTVDIIDALVLSEDQLVNGGLDSALSVEAADTITLKVQTSKKSIVYNLSKTDPMSKLMTAFAATLEVPVNQIKFSFDGDPLSPHQTPSDLDMDHDDIIDARLITNS